MPIIDVVVDADGVMQEVALTAEQETARRAEWAVNAAPRPSQIDAECDRRTVTGFRFGGKAYRLDEKSIARITAMGADARFALLAGAGIGNLRWADPEADFGWIATDNTVTPMDAPTMTAFADAAKLWVSKNTFAARNIKNMSPIPADFADDSRWPS
ncbi:hypothetical protein C3941_09470 [Kaistia algarum]|uniref:DUF4376 domain-containing protein n=1 Tax=Kaistia algarum TaxID=2083279 RepID=UPI000CE74837|nr:hypothetical protein [Kaistia algarum]MCX5512287.1 hypothetical protein [Kaistia algarum]PPE80378.1 hypothetical protein C3941_09470 [Kaistia algarum]